MLKTDEAHILDMARDALSYALPQAWATYVYGSFARGDERTDSDLDLAVLLPPEARIQDLLGLMADIANRVGREVDIVNLREASLDLVHQVLHEGHPLLVRCKSEVLAWEAEQLTDYALFAPRREHIINDYFTRPLGRAP